MANKHSWHTLGPIPKDDFSPSYVGIISDNTVKY